MDAHLEELIKKAAADLLNSQYAIALTGAGVSTESGIPDFRGPSGVWTKNPEAERRAYQGYQNFMSDPKGWWEARLTQTVGFLGDLEKAQPNPSHQAIAELERLAVLKCVITQNIDGLHEKAGTENLLEYHGNTFKLRCVTCESRFSREDFDFDRLLAEDRLPPRCPKCRGLVKSDTVSFGEPIPTAVAHQSLEEAWRCDVMLICGTSAVVYPFANLPRVARSRRTERGLRGVLGGSNAPKAPGAVRIIEVNAEPTPLTMEQVSDYLLQGKTGEILPQIVAEVKRLRAG